MLAFDAVTNEGAYIFVGVQQIDEFQSLFGMLTGGRDSQKSAHSAAGLEQGIHQRNKVYAVTTGSGHGFGSAGSVLNEIGEQSAVVEVVVTVSGVAVVVYRVAAQVACLVPAAYGIAVVHVFFAGVLVKYVLVLHIAEIIEFRYSSRGRQLGIARQRFKGNGERPAVDHAGQADNVFVFRFGFFRDSFQNSSVIFERFYSAHIDAISFGHIAVINDTALPSHLFVGRHAIN